MANTPRIEARELPLVIRPGGEDEAARDVGALCQWLKDEASRVQGWLTRHGALLLRGQAGNDAMQLKGWDEMFLTSDHAVVEEKCREQGFEPTWLPGEALRLVHGQPVTTIR